MDDELAGMPVCGEVVPPGGQPGWKKQVLARIRELLSEWEEEASGNKTGTINLRPELVIYDLLKVVGLADDASLKVVFAHRFGKDKPGGDES